MILTYVLRFLQIFGSVIFLDVHYQFITNLLWTESTCATLNPLALALS
jgi:hypothetical protein